MLEFGEDNHRESFIFVDEMAESEARQLLKVRGARFRAMVCCGTSSTQLGRPP